MKTGKGITPIIAAALVLGLVLSLVFIATQTNFIGSTFQDTDCSFKPYTIDGQQFSTLEEAKNTYQNLGGQNWQDLKQDAELQVKDGVVKARVCERG